jgi:hypothetical protein
MITADQIKVFTSSQGLLAVSVDRGQGHRIDHRWHVSNEGGKWCAYASLADGTTLYCDKDLARHIHRDTLPEQLAEIMNVFSEELAADWAFRASDRRPVRDGEW